MALRKIIVGIDVSKDRLDVFLLGEGSCFEVGNDDAGLAELMRRLEGPVVAAVALEASGGYERKPARRLAEAGFAVRLLDPLRVRRFAQAGGRWAKNDRIDAEVIAGFAGAFEGETVNHDPDREILAEYVAYRRQLNDELVTIAHQARHIETPELTAMSRRRRASLKAMIAKLNRRIAALIGKGQAFARTNAILRSVKGIGPVAAATLIAEFPELGALTRRQAAALLGVAPYDRDSGKKKGARSIFGGRAEVRAVLYMAALAAARFNPDIKAFHQRLSATGKKPKVVTTACMRKLIVTLNALIRDQRPWTPKSACP
jgi:transposase